MSVDTPSKDGALLADDLTLLQPDKFVGYRAAIPRPPDSVLLRNNGLHVETGLRPRASDRGAGTRALLADVVVEGAPSSVIMELRRFRWPASMRKTRSLPTETGSAS